MTAPIWSTDVHIMSYNNQYKHGHANANNLRKCNENSGSSEYFTNI